MKIIGIVLLISFVLIILAGGFFTFSVVSSVKLDKSKLEAPSPSLIITDVTGTPVAYTSDISKLVNYDDLPPCVVDAFVSVEDKKFFYHNGIDYKRIAGATVNNIKAGYIREGGSTITQQLAKNAQLSNEKTFNRKLKEYSLAKQIEKAYSKEEILAMYLNTVYFGSGYYGITTAAKGYFGKDVDELTLSEAAILAGVVKNPRDYSPKNNAENAAKRMELVLKVMKDDGKITESEYEKALAYEYVLPKTRTYDFSYTTEAIYEATSILNITEVELVTGGYTVITYLDKAEQNAVNKAIKAENLQAENADCSIIRADNSSGGITAYSSTHSYPLNVFRRQPASVIKPLLVYAPALESGYISPATPVFDEKRDFGGYSPSNYGDNYLGWTTARTALAKSSNTVAVSLMHELGSDYCIDFAEDVFGLTFDSADGLSSALGGMTYGTTLKELTRGYMTIASGGIYKDITFIKEIKNADGKTIYLNKTVEKERLSAETAYLLTEMLENSVSDGTAKSLKSISSYLASKTGTSGNLNGNTDAYNASFTTKSTTIVWYGAKEGCLMNKSVTGGGLPTLCAKYIYEVIGEKPAPFTAPDEIIELEIDTFATDIAHVLYLADVFTPESDKKWEIFNEKNASVEFSPYNGGVIPLINLI